MNDQAQPSTSQPPLRLGTRGSLLARTQSGMVADELIKLRPGLRIELVIVKTSGDRITDQPLHAFGGKGLFTKELEQALLAGEIDFAVHSFKDVPVTMPLVDTTDLIIAAVPVREDPRDVLVCATARTLTELPAGARVGTGSLRRRCQILAIRPDLIVEPVRGNIDTRLRKVRAGEFHAIVLALAGIKRTGLFDPATMTPIGQEMLCAPGQGALALQCRRDDEQSRATLNLLNDARTARCVEAERAVVLGLHGDCHSPIAAYATETDGRFQLRAAVGRRDGEPPVVSARRKGSSSNINNIVAGVLDDLREQGVDRLLSENP